MKNIALEILKAASAAKLPIQVLSEGDELYLGFSWHDAWEHVKSVDDAVDVVITTDRREWMQVGSADLGFEPDETVIDHTSGGWIEREWDRINEENNQP